MSPLNSNFFFIVTFIVYGRHGLRSDDNKLDLTDSLSTEQNRAQREPAGVTIINHLTCHTEAPLTVPSLKYLNINALGQAKKKKRQYLLLIW